MKKFLRALMLAALSAAACSCNDNLSQVGETIQPDNDKVQAKVDSLTFTAKSVPVDSVFSRSTYTLLGDLQDPLYGHLKADFIAQLQSARNFRFSNQPREGQIDSVCLAVSYGSWAGDSTAWMKAAVYEIKKPIKRDRYSDDMSKYLDERNFLGERAFRAADPKGIHRLRVWLPKTLGQRFYDLSLNDPGAFNTDESFYAKVLGGLYTTTTTGTGCVLSVQNTALEIYYTYQSTQKDSKGRDSIVWEVGKEEFANTKQQILVNRFANSGLDKLLTNTDPNFTYVKTPGGVSTELTFRKEDLTRALLTDPKTERLINEVNLSIATDLPAGKVLLNPPTYLLLLPKDSLATFFPEQQTELTRRSTSCLSSSYSIASRYYTFGNIARVFSEHVRLNTATADNGKREVTKDLVLQLVPVSRQYRTVGQKHMETTAIDNFIFPSAARLATGPAARRVGLVSTGFVRNP